MNFRLLRLQTKRHLFILLTLISQMAEEVLVIILLTLIPNISKDATLMRSCIYLTGKIGSFSCCQALT